MAVRTEELTPPLHERLSATPSTIVGVLATAMCVCMWPTWAALAKIWSTMADYAHGPVVAVGVAAWLIALRDDIDAQPVRPALWALAPLGLSIVLWLIARQGASELLQQALLPLIALTAVLAALGGHVLRVVLAPLAALYLAIPVWEPFVPLLQWMTTQIAEHLLGWLGVPTIVEGNNVTIPAGRFTVAEGCSGKRYLLIGLTFAAALGALQRLRLSRFALLAVASVGIALLVNWLRVVTIIYAGQASNMQHYLVATEHVSLGYALFAPLLLAILYVGRRLGRNATAPTGPGVTPPARASIAAWAAPLALIVVPIIGSAAHSPDLDPPTLGRLPILTGAWQGPLPPAAVWEPRFAEAVAEMRAAYAQDGRRIDVYVNVYGEQTQGRELIHFTNSTTPADRWPSVSTVDGDESLQTLIAQHSPGQRWMIAQTYVVGGRATSSQLFAQMLYGAHALLRPAPAGVVALATPCTPDCDAARAAIDDFRAAHGGAVAALIPTRM
jgi:EpsI family protein